MKKFIKSLLLFLVICLFLLTGYDISMNKLGKTFCLNKDEDKNEELLYAYYNTPLIASSNTPTEPSTEGEEEPKDPEGPPEQIIPQPDSIEDVEGSVPDNYYEDMLMIGDSRVFAWYEYGETPGANYFAKDGMSVYSLRKTRLDTCGYEQISLQELLEARQFKRIYFMIGLNELADDLDTNIVKYAEWVDLFIATQPDAEIVLCANLHVSKRYNDKNQYENNANINYVNEKMEQIAKDRNLLWVDCNPIFDDADGNLGADYSGDGCHPYAKYLKNWTIWLANYVNYRT